MALKLDLEESAIEYRRGREVLVYVLEKCFRMILRMWMVIYILWRHIKLVVLGYIVHRIRIQS